MKFDGLVKVRQDAPMHESVCKAGSEIVERQRSIRMTGGTKE
jgi:hypothetical protein